MSNLLAGKKARVLYRTSDGAVTLQVEDEHDEVLLTVHPDGTMSEHRIVGFGAGVGEAWEAAADRRDDPAFDPVPVEPSPVLSRGVPVKFAGRERSEPEPEPEPVKERGSEPVPEPVSVPGSVPGSVVEAARSLAVVVHSRAVGMTVGELYQGKHAGRVDEFLTHAVAMSWVVVSAGVVCRGPVDPRPAVTVGDVDSPAWGRRADAFGGRVLGS